jgi:hypothetical protein
VGSAIGDQAVEESGDPPSAPLTWVWSSRAPNESLGTIDNDFEETDRGTAQRKHRFMQCGSIWFLSISIPPSASEFEITAIQ